MKSIHARNGKSQPDMFELAIGTTSLVAYTFAVSHDNLRSRTKQFALDVIQMTNTLPNKPAAWAISKQILRSATSVAANYRAAGRGRSRAEFVAKLGTVLEEADETAFWLEMIADANLLGAPQVESLQREANELVRIFSASVQTARTHQRDSPS
jgi:four helix bundle protein